MANPNDMYDKIYAEKQRQLQTGNVPFLSSLHGFMSGVRTNLEETPKYLQLAQNKVNHVLGINSNEEVAQRKNLIEAYHKAKANEDKKRKQEKLAYEKNTPIANELGQIAGINKAGILMNALQQYGTEPYLDK